MQNFVEAVLVVLAHSISGRPQREVDFVFLVIVDAMR
jgi:hypothetical protein